MSLLDIAIDFGTSSVKIGVFEGYLLVHKYKGVRIEEVKDIIDKHKPARIMVCSVSHKYEELEEILSGYSLAYLNSKTRLPFSLEYSTVDTLGKDRIAAVAGAQYMFPKKNCLIIDAGSCITYEVLTSDNKYLGGAISPGIDIRFKSLHNFTANLPLLKREDNVKLTGNSTQSSIQSGVIWGITSEIREIIRIYSNKLPDLQLVICGGDANYLAELLKIELKVAPDLVLVGLINLLNYNEK